MDIDTIISQLVTSGVTACFTIIGGISVFVFGQLILRFFVEPIIEQSKLISTVADSITFYANVFSNPNMSKDEDKRTASEHFRKLASQLRATAWTIHWYPLWQIFGFVPNRKKILKASAELIGLSNGFWDDVSFRMMTPDRIQTIKDLLDFK